MSADIVLVAAGFEWGSLYASSSIEPSSIALLFLYISQESIFGIFIL